MGGKPLSSSPILQDFVRLKNELIAKLAAGQFNGRGIASAAINTAGHLILTYTDGTTQDAGLVVGAAISSVFATGIWNDAATWSDTDIWKDAP